MSIIDPAGLAQPVYRKPTQWPTVDGRELAAALRKASIDREAMAQRMFTDPVAHTVAHIVGQVLDSREARDHTVLDATAAILALFEENLHRPAG